MHLMADAVARPRIPDAMLGCYCLYISVIVSVHETRLQSVVVDIRDRALRLHSRDAHGLKFKIRHRAGRVLSQSLVDAKAYLRALYHLAAQQMFLYYLLCYRLPHLSTP